MLRIHLCIGFTVALIIAAQGYAVSASTQASSTPHPVSAADGGVGAVIRR